MPVLGENLRDTDGKVYFLKDPEGVDVFSLDFAAHPIDPPLTDGETLVNIAAVSSDAALVIGDGVATVATDLGVLTPSAPLYDDTVATIWASGGVAGTDYEITVAYLTSTGHFDNTTFRVKCREL